MALPTFCRNRITVALLLEQPVHEGEVAALPEGEAAVDGLPFPCTTESSLVRLTSADRIGNMSTVWGGSKGLPIPR